LSTKIRPTEVYAQLRAVSETHGKNKRNPDVHHEKSREKEEYT
jgi:hypothetical protein